MKPTGLTIRKNSSKSNVLAFVDITFDDIFTVKNFRIVKGQKGLFLGMPSKPNPKDPKQFFNDVFIVGAAEEGTAGRDFSDRLQAYVLRKFQEAPGEAFEDQTRKPQSRPAHQTPKNSGAFSDDVPF